MQRKAVANAREAESEILGTRNRKYYESEILGTRNREYQESEIPRTRNRKYKESRIPGIGNTRNRKYQEPRVGNTRKSDIRYFLKSDIQEISDIGYRKYPRNRITKFTAVLNLLQC